jgi:hypothetical protein
MRCSNCNIKINKKFNLCPNCGKKIILNKKNKEKKFDSKFLILFLLLFAIAVGLIIFMNKGYSIDTIRKSVVKINVYDESGEIIQTGSGFVVFDKNILVTNAHVITGGDTADAVTESDEKIYIDGAIYYNQDEDIAILKLNNQNSLKPLKISKKCKVGEKVIAIGSPLGIKNSVSEGKIIQHTAPISHGSSGGTLFNSKGYVIGMNTASYTDGQNINLSISIETIEKAYKSSKDLKSKSIKDIQYLDENIKSVILNNNAGKEIVEIVKNINKTDNEIVVNGIQNYKQYVSGYYLYKLADSKIASDWAFIKIGNTFDKNEKYIESELPYFIIIKLNDTSTETTSAVKQLISDDINGYYKEAVRLQEYSELKIESCVYENHTYNCGDLSDKTLTAKLSNDYINALKNPVISSFNDYVYAIVSKDSEIIEKLEKQIKLLP